MLSKGDKYSRTNNLICRLFGHIITGYNGNVPYLCSADKWAYRDNTGIKHVPLYGHCDRCDKDILVAKIHMKENKNDHYADAHAGT